jgi:hypothetical protein
MTMSIPPTKDFTTDFWLLMDHLRAAEPFAFSRFSDGEIFMMQNQEIVMARDHCKVKGQVHKIKYAEDDLKHFDPAHHQFYRRQLIGAFVHRQHNYYKGLSCRCCIGDEDFKWQLNILGRAQMMGAEDRYDIGELTWSNLLINANYLLFINEMVPVLREYPIVIVVNKNASLASLRFNITKEFRVGPQCITNDYGIIEEIDQFINTDKVEGRLFLFAASSLSNMAIHKLYEKYPQNTYMDIGSALNPFMPGIGSRRNYMNQFTQKKVTYKPCIW